MVFASAVTVPANTPQSNPSITSLPVVKGILHNYKIIFPPGPSGLVGVAVYMANTQWIPRVRDTYFIGDAINLDFDDTFEVTDEQPELRLFIYNTDDTYAHTVLLTFTIETEPGAIAALLPGQTIQGLTAAVSANTAAIADTSTNNRSLLSKIFGGKT